MSTYHIINASIQGSPFDFESIISWLSERCHIEYGKVVMGCSITDYMEPQSEAWFTQLEGDTSAIGKIYCYLDPDMDRSDFTISHIRAKIEKADLSILWPTWELIQKEIEEHNEFKTRMDMGEDPSDIDSHIELDEISKKIKHYFYQGLKDKEIGMLVGLGKDAVRSRRYEMDLKHFTQKKKGDK